MATKGNTSLHKGIPTTKDAFVVIVKTEWNAHIINKLEAGAKKVLKEQNVKFKVLTVPGAVEIPFAVKAYQENAKQKADAFITLGTVIRGDTPHFDYVCKAVTDGVLSLNMMLDVPIIFGVLTVENEQQAMERVGGIHGHKGEEAAITALKMIALNHSFKNKIPLRAMGMNVQIFIPCFVDQLYPQVAFNMVKVLEKLGCTVTYNANQTCCGQPAFNAGFWGESKEVCSKFMNDFSGADYIVAPSASCVGFVRNYYPKLFETAANHKDVVKLGQRTFELSDFLINVLKVDDIGATFNGKATYHDSCAGLRECGIKQEPRKLLSKVKGLELVEMNDVETCCGFGGTFAVKFEPISIAMADQKITNSSATEAEYIISTDMSCLMHIGGRIKNKNANLQVLHLADVLASGW